ncbi:MAG: hypothetical protein Kow0092_13350 [Deferrisomatales bacterium]
MHFHRFHLLAHLFSVLLFLLSSSINTVAAAWGLSYLVIGLINLTGAAAYVVSSLYLGHWGDRLGYKRVLAGALTLFAAFLWGGFFWSEPAHLFLFAVGVNGFFGVFFPTVEGLLSSQEKREGVDPVATTVRFTLSWSSGNALGMALGPYLIQRLPPVVFGFGIALCLAAAAGVFRHRKRHGDSLPGPYPVRLRRAPAPVDLPRIGLYRRAYRLTFLLSGIVYSAVMALFPKLMALYAVPLDRAGFIVVGVNLGVFATFAVLGSFRRWVGAPRLCFWLLLVFPLGAASFWLPPSVPAFFGMALLVGVTYAVPYTFALFYGLNSPDEDHGRQGSYHEAIVGVIFGLGPLLGGLFLDLWPDPRSLGAMAAGLWLASLANQVNFLRKLAPQAA